jgi:hypothetical protein
MKVVLSLLTRYISDHGIRSFVSFAPAYGMDSIHLILEDGLLNVIFLFQSGGDIRDIPVGQPERVTQLIALKAVFGDEVLNLFTRVNNLYPQPELYYNHLPHFCP